VSAEATVLLVGAAFATAAFTATVGLGGGVILLALMLLFLEPLVAIPVHGVVQLVSNSTRTWIQRRHTRWGIVARYAALLLPMGYLGLAMARSLEPDQLRLGIGFFVLAATWAPPRLWVGGRGEISPAVFIPLGGVIGFLNTTVGATGPFIGPFFRSLGLSRQGVVGTFAACQMVGHLAKILVFVTVGFAFAAYLPLIALLSVGVIAGTWVGSQLLERISERAFRLAYQLVLTAVALRLVWDGVRAL
jgi:uncharacterized membrane protein YfcA